MPWLNIEIKAKCKNPGSVRDYLKKNNAEFKGTDHQTDIYFKCNHGRLKLRTGNIEKALIAYDRNNQAGPKGSSFSLAKLENTEAVREALTRSLGIKVIVDKRREIWYLDNVKFHIDEVDGLGSFMEIEAGNLLADLDIEALKEQCELHMKALGIKDEDLLQYSYSDMLMEQERG